MADPGRLLSDQELEAAEMLVRAGLRWTQVGGPNKIMPAFDLILADLRRSRAGASRLRYHHAHDGVAHLRPDDPPPLPRDAECATCREHDALGAALREQ